MMTAMPTRTWQICIFNEQRQWLLPTRDARTTSTGGVHFVLLERQGERIFSAYGKSYWVLNDFNRNKTLFLAYVYLFCFVLFLVSACSRREYSDLLWYPAKVDVHFSQRETKDWYVNISWTPLTGKQTLLMPVITITMMMMMMVMMK